MFTAVLLLSIFISIVITRNVRNDDKEQHSFLGYISRHKKTYNNDEYNYRLSIFRKKMKKIEEHNKKNSNYKLGLNKFSDLTDDEFKLQVFNQKLNEKYHSRPNKQNTILNKNNQLNDLPEEIDWSKTGAVSEVKNQGSDCLSDYAFSATGAIEGAYFIKYNKSISLSEQYLVDCSASYGNSGCEGGIMTICYGYVVENGICLEEDYHYHGAFETCLGNTCEKVVTLKGWDIVPPAESELEIGVSQKPISIAFNLIPLQDYKSGIFDDICTAEINYGALAVGYGIENNNNSTKYWKIKLSLGSDFGEDGYVRIIKGLDELDGRCGVAVLGTFPIIQDN